MNINKIRENMKNIKIRAFVIFLIISGISAKAQTVFSCWNSQIGIGDNPVLMHGDMVLESGGELYTGNGRLEITGSYRGIPGSKVFRSITAGTGDISRFLYISDGAEGSTEIIPEMDANWDGSPVELVKAKQNDPDAGVFYIRPLMPDCGEYYVQLQHEVNENHSLWSVTGTRTLPLIKQLRNHTLLVNNNPLTNGGHNFTYYKWYRDGQLLKEGSHDEYGGSYYTGGASLDADAVYTVEATDADGKQYFSCPYQYIPFASSIHVSVYPNPVSRNVTAYIQAETQDLSLLKDAVVDIYDLTGQYAGQTEINGQSVTPLDLPAKQGIYLLKFRAKDFIQTIKLIVE
jgi:hypothetical protein